MLRAHAESSMLRVHAESLWNDNGNENNLGGHRRKNLGGHRRHGLMLGQRRRSSRSRTHQRQHRRHGPNSGLALTPTLPLALRLCLTIALRLGLRRGCCMRCRLLQFFGRRRGDKLLLSCTRWRAAILLRGRRLFWCCDLRGQDCQMSWRARHGLRCSVTLRGFARGYSRHGGSHPQERLIRRSTRALRRRSHPQARLIRLTTRALRRRRTRALRRRSRRSTRALRRGSYDRGLIVELPLRGPPRLHDQRGCLILTTVS